MYLRRYKQAAAQARSKIKNTPIVRICVEQVNATPRRRLSCSEGKEDWEVLRRPNCADLQKRLLYRRPPVPDIIIVLTFSPKATIIL